jgi:hypothetical protein
MVDLGGKADLGRLERVIGRKAYREEKDATRVGGITLGSRSLIKSTPQGKETYRSHYRRLPLKHIVTSWSSTA